MRKKPPVILKEIREKKLPEIDYATQKSISYPQMSMFNECPKKWSLQYREGHKQFTSSIHTVFGTALHEVLQHYLTVMYEQSGAEADRINTAEMLEEKLREEYKKQYQANNNQHFVTPDELREFYDDGVEIIREIAKERSKHFSKRGWYLVGCEVPLVLTPNPKLQNIMFQGFLDVVLYHEPTNTFKIIDIKTSRQGWSKKEKSKKCAMIMHTEIVSDHGTDLEAVRKVLFPKYPKAIYFSTNRLDINQLNQLYNIADAQILLTSNEGWGLSLTEAILAGTPIIANVTGGMQDQMRFEDEKGNWINFSKDFPSNHRGTYKKHGAWAFPVYPASISIQGSPQTPYISADRVRIEDVVDQINKVYHIPSEIRTQIGLEGRKWAISDEAGFTGEKMGQRIINYIDELFLTWKPRKNFELINTKNVEKRVLNHKLQY